MKHLCKYCNKEFVKESTLAAHLCEPKRRWQQQNDAAVQLGFKSYLRFYEITQGSAKLKTYEDFSKSSYYLAFVKFGRHLIAIRAVNPVSYTDWLLKNNKKLDHWCKDQLYTEWLYQYLRKESVQDAIERALKEMQSYADIETKLQNNFANYFKFGSSNLISKHISDGRISPWVVYNSDSGIQWLNQANQDQVKIIMPAIDPDFWQQKFRDYVSDTEWCKHILQNAGL
jgi:hypothetical protein